MLSYCSGNEVVLCSKPTIDLTRDFHPFRSPIKNPEIVGKARVKMSGKVFGIGPIWPYVMLRLRV